MRIRRFKETDADAVSALIIQTMRTINTRDYPAEVMEDLITREQPDDILKKAQNTHFYVAEEDGRIIGCGAIGPFEDKENESSMYSVFTHCAFQGRGVGKAIMEALEHDPYFLGSDRTEIAASITGMEFYRKLGYTFTPGGEILDENSLYHMEKTHIRESE